MKYFTSHYGFYTIVMFLHIKLEGSPVGRVN